MCPLACCKPCGLVIEEEHPEEVPSGNRCAEAFGYKQMDRDDADRAGADQGRPGGVIANPVASPP